MNNRLSVTLTFFVSWLVVANALAGGTNHWGYSGHEGPAYWGDLDPSYALCSEGKNQIPIDIAGMIDSELSPIAFNYQPGGNQVLNNGHTIQVKYTPGSTITVNGHEFELKQFHFHAPSENVIEGQAYPMEAHFVHADMHGNLAVVALMFKLGESNRELGKARAIMPDKPHAKKALAAPVNADMLLPRDRTGLLTWKP